MQDLSSVAISEEHLDLLLEKMYNVKGWDFRRYRRSSIKRCVERRIAVSRHSCHSYIKLLDSEPSEFNNLFNHITIKVSEFFRDTEVFHRIEDYVIPMILRQLKLKGNNRLRIWSSGCAQGEEPFSIAILIFRKLKEIRENYDVKIFATDIDEAAINRARKGIFGEDSLENVNSTLRNKLFQSADNDLQILPEIRNLVTFGVHDLVSNIHLSHMDIMLCRNLLIYFEKGLQEKVFEKFCYSLKQGGFLILGKSEVVPLPYRDQFFEVCKREKIYRKI